MVGSAIYRGVVAHARLRPRRHRLRYRVFSLLLDLDELPDLSRDLRLFGYNRPALVSFHDCDHGDGREGGLRRWVERHLDGLGIALSGGPIRLLCYPRIMGYVFNPLSVFFCYRPGGELAAILYEVSNTFAERHTYVIPVIDSDSSRISQTCEKAFYVSPFLPMDCRYHFEIAPPGDQVGVTIEQDDSQGRIFAASYIGRQGRLDDRGLLGALTAHPLMTLKVMAGIHWEALRLWLKGVPAFRHAPARDRLGTTLVHPPHKS